MQRILVNILSSRSGGAISYVRNLIPRLCQISNADDQVDVSILSDEHNIQLLETLDYVNKKFITAPTANLSSITRIRWEKRNLSSVVAENDIDVLFTPYQVISTKTKARDVIMVRNMEPFLASCYHYGLKGRVRNYVLRRATAASVRSAHQVVAVSGFVRDYLENRLEMEPSRVICIHHGRDKYFERSGNCHHSDETASPMFLTCGSLLPYRRCEDVIDAFATVARRFPEREPTLIVAGEGTEPRYRALLERRALDSGSGNRIRFVGHVSKDRMKDLFHNCYASILATEIEACPNTAIEALTSGCAIIASNTPPLPEILGDAAFYYPPRNVEKLTEQMVQFLEGPELATKYRETARNRAERYDWDTCAQQTFELLASS